MDRVLLIGATSAIAQQVGRIYAEAGARLHLLARNGGKLRAVAEDLRVRGAADVRFESADLADMALHEGLLARSFGSFGGFDVVLLAYGSLPDQESCEKSVERTMESVRVNFLSAISWVTLVSNRFEAEGKGTVAVISSVAGDRGRGSNYVYGASKGGMSLFLQGLRNRLHRSGVHVLTVKPGFVDTPMTAHLKKNFLFASPERSGRALVRAIRKRKDVAYVPGFWRWIMLPVIHIPERIFKRLAL